MSGSIKGTAAIITEKHIHATYLHCASHCLNLVVVKSLQSTDVRNLMNIVGKVYFFFDALPKRQKKLEDAIIDTPSSTISKLKDLCRTHWVQRLDAFSVFSTLYQSVLVCLENICHDGLGSWSSNSITDANTLKQAISSTNFIASFVITNSSLQYLHSLTVNLQGSSTDIIQAVKEIGNVTTTIQKIMDDFETYHDKWFIEIEKMCDIAGKVPSTPRTCSRQAHHSNTPASSPSQYYLHTISILLIDHLLSELKSSFSKHQRCFLWLNLTHR